MIRKQVTGSVSSNHPISTQSSANQVSSHPTAPGSTCTLLDCFQIPTRYQHNAGMATPTHLNILSIQMTLPAVNSTHISPFLTVNMSSQAKLLHSPETLLPNQANSSVRSWGKAAVKSLEADLVAVCDRLCGSHLESTTQRVSVASWVRDGAPHSSATRYCPPPHTHTYCL